MDAYPPKAEIDALGRRGGPRRRLPLEQKRRIAEETLQPGASVALVARRHDLNANVVFAWRRKYREGGLGDASHTPGLIPIKLLPSEAVAQMGRSCASAVSWRVKRCERSLPRSWRADVAFGHAHLGGGRSDGYASQL